MTTTTVLRPPAEQPSPTITRLLVTVRDPDTRSYRPVGFLAQAPPGEFTFAYLRREVERDGFRPLPGLGRAVGRSMTSPTLFPLFAERVISARRPDRTMSLDALGLPADAAPFEVLVRSHGHRVGDTIELLPAPVVEAGGEVSFTFLAHGIRHLPEASQQRIGHLGVGEPLRLTSDPGNPVNPQALLVTDTGRTALGWMPDPLLEVVEGLRERRLSVERANAPDVGYHFRLQIRVRGLQPAGARSFHGSSWATVGDGSPIDQV